MDTTLAGSKNYIGGTYMLGIIGFIFGIIAFVGGFIPVAGSWLARPGAFAAILLCAFALAKAIRNKEPIDGSVIAGLALGIAIL